MIAQSLARFALAALMAVAVPTHAAQAGGWAIGGMDAVELRDHGKLAAGRPDIATHWRGQDWLFTAEPHRNAFELNPRRYAPGFGGMCPVHLSEGRATLGRPEFALVVGGRLYLMESETGRAAMAARPKRISWTRPRRHGASWESSSCGP